jgi:hypothetical protein
METTILKQEFDEHNREIYRELSNDDYVRWWYLNDDWEKIEYNNKSQLEIYENSKGMRLISF